jgi:hypothetical protein
MARVHIGEIRDPDLADHARYDDLFRSVCRPMDDRLRPLIWRPAGSRPIPRTERQPTFLAALTTMLLAKVSCQPCLVGLWAVV